MRLAFKGGGCAALMMLCGCQQQTATKTEAPTFRVPSATEAFELQTKCTELGRRIMEDNVIGNALTQDQVSHYNSSDNRCYVKLSVSTADLSTPYDDSISDVALYDGQSGELLASRNRKGNTEVSSYLFDSSLQHLLQGPQTPDSINELIDKFVTTHRTL